MKRTISNIKRGLFFAAATCMLVLFVGCSANNVPNAVVESSSTPAVSSTSLAETEHEQASEQNPMSLEKREAQFLQMANHDNYITGEILEVDLQPYPKPSYLVVQCEEKQYRVVGSLGQEHEGLQPFVVSYSYCGKEGQECKLGEYATVFYGDDLSNGETTIALPKDIFFYDVTQEVVKTQYLAQILVENFMQIENKQIYTPDEAMLRVAEHLGLENAQKKERSAGLYYYTADNVEITFMGIEYNLYFGIDRAQAAEIYQLKSFLDANKFPYDTTIASPFIEYEIAVFEGSNNWPYWPEKTYAVDITGSIHDAFTDRYERDPN